jgi:predicted butyrate kinase (DUF1464 family)
MPRVVGIDPGTRSFDLCGLDDGHVFLETSLPASAVASQPATLLDLLLATQPLDLIAGPSGYGLPCVPIQACGERELRLMLLGEAGERGGVGGIRRLVAGLAERKLPVVFLPGAIHLATVPPHRKLNRVDVGTADKVCAAAFAIDDQARRLGLEWREAAFVLVELGFAFTAVLSVARGQIVSGQGGSSGPLGYLSGGALDAETAFLLGPITKETVFSGGAAFVAGAEPAGPEELFSRDDGPARIAHDALTEGVLRAVAAELAAVPGPREVVLSGRLARVPPFREALTRALTRLAPVHVLQAGAVKEAARGAALIADGLAGGRYAGLVDAMRLRESHGTALDHLFLAGAQRPRAWVASAS